MFCKCLRKNNTVLDKECDEIKDVVISNKLHKHFLKYKNSDILFDINEYNPVKLGFGTSSIAYKITVENDEFTCKYYKKKDKTSIKHILKEIDTLKQIKSEKFPFFCTYLHKHNDIYLFYDYIVGEDLFEILDKKYHKIDSINIQTNIIYEITNALYSLFKLNFVHLDLKPENIIISNFIPIKLKLIDLECVHNTKYSKVKRECGTIGYTPPEVLLYRRYYYNSDVWSLGCIFFLMVARFSILPTELEGYITSIKEFTSIYKIDNTITRFLSFLPKNVTSLLDEMLKYHHTERINITQILKSNLIKTYIENNL